MRKEFDRRFPDEGGPLGFLGVRKHLRHAENHTGNILKNSEIAHQINTDAYLCLEYLLAQSNVLGNLTRNTSAYDDEFPLYHITGGPGYNPHRIIDEVGIDLFEDFIVSRWRVPVSAFVEEYGWKNFNLQQDGRLSQPKRTVIYDSLDDTSGIAKSSRDKCFRTQSTGMIVLDENGQFIVGGIANLVDGTILIISGDRPYHLKFDHGSGKLEEIESRIDGLASGSKFQKISLAINDSRRAEFSGSRFASEVPYKFDYLTFGGFGVLKLLENKVNIMSDMWKGQEWYEAYIWAMLALKTGLNVSLFDMKGKPVSITDVLESGKRNNSVRFKVVISNISQIDHEGAVFLLSEKQVKQD